MSKLLWMAGQALAIAGLTFMFASAPRPDPIDPLGALLLSVVIVAFGTAAAVNLWDWLFRRRRAHNVGEPQSRGGRPGRIGRQPRELTEQPFRRRIGEDAR